jgi:hypothetical protein
MAQSGSTNRVYLDQTLNLQLPTSEEHPEGEVRVLQQGWNEIPDELMNHPIIKRLRPESEEEGSRRQQVLEAAKKRNEAVAKAEQDYANELNEVEKSRQEELQQRTEERDKRIREKEERGEVSYEPHPDPDAAHAEALTLPPSRYIVSAAGMAYKGDETVAGGQRRVMESGMSGQSGGQSAQGGSGYARQNQAHQTTAPVVDADGKPAGTNKDELTGASTESVGGTAPATPETPPVTRGSGSRSRD